MNVHEIFCDLLTYVRTRLFWDALYIAFRLQSQTKKNKSEKKKTTTFSTL